MTWTPVPGVGSDLTPRLNSNLTPSLTSTSGVCNLTASLTSTTSLGTSSGLTTASSASPTSTSAPLVVYGVDIAPILVESIVHWWWFCCWPVSRGCCPYG